MMTSMTADGRDASHTRQALEVPHATVTPVLVAELLAQGERMPVYVHVIDHPDGRVLVDTGMTQLHFDHRSGNHLFTGRPIYVQRQELDDARTMDEYTIREWVEAADVDYVPVDGERLVRALNPHEVCLAYEHQPWRPTRDLQG